MFIGLLGKDLSKHLKSESTYLELTMKANEWAKRTVSVLNKIQGGLIFKGIELISENEAAEYRRSFTAFSGFCDKLANYTSEARMKNFQFSVDDINRVLEAKPLMKK